MQEKRKGSEKRNLFRAMTQLRNMSQCLKVSNSLQEYGNS